MIDPVQLYCWHFMAYPYLPADFDARYDSGWVTVPNSLWDHEKSRGLYQRGSDLVSSPGLARAFRDRRALGRSPGLFAAFHARIADDA